MTEEHLTPTVDTVEAVVRAQISRALGGRRGMVEAAVPTLIFEGNDDVHAPEVARRMAELIPGNTFLPSPWSNEDWLDKFTGRKTGSVFELYPLLAPAILDFVKRSEAA